MGGASRFEEGPQKMAETLKALRELPLEELIKRHDESAKTTMVGVAYYLEEIARRDAMRQTEEMLRHTNAIRRYTVVITILTVINVAAVIFGVLKEALK